MPIKKLIQTRWKITADTIVIYPYGAIYLLSLVFGMIVLIMMVFVLPPGNEISILLPVYLFYFLCIAILFLFARTKIMFDKSQRIMVKLLFGFIKTTQLRFDEILGIMPVRTTKGGFRYYVIPKKTKWWNIGTPISSGFLNETSPHAVDLQTHLLSAITQFMHKKIVITLHK
jgi:hypothetical protein